MRFLILATILFVPIVAFTQTLTGVVVDGNGAAIEKAAVILLEGNLQRAKTLTDNEGRFSMSAVIGQRSRLTVMANGFAPFERVLKNDGVWDFTIVMRPAEVGADVTVSVTGVETTQADAAASIAVITIESLAVTASRPVDDVVRQVAGFQLFRRSSSRTTNPTAQGANLRGLSGSGASRASVLFDGLSVNDAFGGWTYWSRVPLIAVEQIEVFRGGASSVYGSGGLSGAVNIVPLKLSGDKQILKLESSLGTQNTADVSGALLVSRRKWEFDLFGDLFRTDGYIPVEESFRGLVDAPSASRYSNLILKLGRRFGEKNRAFVRGNLFAERRDNGTHLTDNRTYFRQIAAGADLSSRRFGDLTFRAFGEDQVYDQTFSAVSPDRNSETLTRSQRVPSYAFGSRLGWKKKFSEHFVAASAEFSRARGYSDEIGFFNGLSTSVSSAGGVARDLSLFVQDTWTVRPRLTLNLSARIDQRRNSDGSSVTRSLSTGLITGTRFVDRTDTAFSPRFGAIYEIDRNISVYASFSHSFRSPSLNELYRGFRVGNILTEANAFLTPERATTFEGGGSAYLLERKLVARASAFTTLVSDPVVSVTLATTPTIITRQRQNVGSTRSSGIELDAQFWPTSDLKLTASYLLVDSRITDFPASRDLEGKVLPQVPRHSFAAQASYKLRERWNLSAQVRAASSQFEDDRNTLQLRKYLTADARVSYKLPRFIEAFVAIENIFDSRYDIALTPVRSIAQPRSLRIGLRFNSSPR